MDGAPHTALSFAQLGILHPGREQLELERVGKFRAVTEFERESAVWHDGFQHYLNATRARSEP